MNKRFKVYIFDLDDTLYNEREYVKQAFSNVANYLAGYSDKDSEYFYSSIIKALEQDGRGRIFNRIIDENTSFGGRKHTRRVSISIFSFICLILFGSLGLTSLIITLSLLC